MTRAGKWELIKVAVVYAPILVGIAAAIVARRQT
ncbi:hypothetical protein DFJ67_3226 [Asanoa ferruginea]|uniref:Uncharacterized protein n=1 Tax=Asanoa ferruginea TaxID=53367 RepID=A0A3D9ZK45_9ACTN|nr:hypothetical protein DFJ67_3226 [Asanoa ferruginea]